jgi:DNA-binding GntR family transcriptional regulator
MTQTAQTPRLSLSERVYEHLKARLMDGQIEPGSRLVIDRLVEDLGVSHTPLREALARLESDQLVVKSPNRRYTSTPLLDGPRMLQLFEARLVLEPASAELATARADEHLAARLATALRTMERAPHGGRYEQYRDLAEADATFHGALCEASGNPYLHEMFDRLRVHQHTARLYTRGGGVPDVAASVAEHRAVLDAVRTGDASAAGDAMRVHLQHSRARMFAILDPSLPHHPHD